WLLEEMPLFRFLRRGLVPPLEPRRSFLLRAVARFVEMALLSLRG
ncbi:hypothetical protein A2U01_0073798, partial [Trifolium medium]|nr:hypothetical protein [Trifolium medium]